MPIKRDDANRRWVEMELVVPGTPEEVWHAIATGAGTSAWFVPTSVEERVGGAITFDLGDMGDSSGTVTEWEPPHRFAYEESDWSEGAPPVATEITVTSRSGDQCVIRMVHSLFTSDDRWDGELEGFEQGWPGFFDVLRIYLEHFAGQPVANIHAGANCPGTDLDVWKSMTSALGLAGVNVGEHHATAPEAPALAGVVEAMHQDMNSRRLVMRLDEPGVAVIGSFTFGGTARGAINIYLYGEDAARTADSVRDQWTRWLQANLQPEQAVTRA